MRSIKELTVCSSLLNYACFSGVLSIEKCNGAPTIAEDVVRPARLIAERLIEPRLAQLSAAAGFGRLLMVDQDLFESGQSMQIERSSMREIGVLVKRKRQLRKRDISNDISVLAAIFVRGDLGGVERAIFFEKIDQIIDSEVLGRVPGSASVGENLVDFLASQGARSKAPKIF